MLQLSEAFILLLRRLQTEVGSWESLGGRWMGVEMTVALPAAGKVLKGILNPFSIFSPHPPLFFPYLLGWMRWVEGLGRGEREGQESREWRVFGTLYAV